MLECHAHVAVLRELRASAAAAFAGDPSLAGEVDALCAAVDTDPDAALLGACVDQLVTHASSDGRELELLESAAALWGRGRELYDVLAQTRADLEAALVDPAAPGALGLLQAGVGRLDGLRTGALQLAHESASLQQQIAPLPHLDRHPRQDDEPSAVWSWRDAFLGRRTDAFVRETFRHAGTDRARSLAFGVLSSYAGNVSGSAYLGCVTGGPRRAHRYRDRLARNAVGSWLHGLPGAPSTTELAQSVSFTGTNGAPAVPGDLAAVLEQALAGAFPSRPAPDLDLGLQRLVRQLELLDSFERPPLPLPPPLELAQAGAPTGTVSVKALADDLNLPTTGVGQAPDGGPADADAGDSSKASGDACLAILIALITVGIAILVYCIGKWSDDETCSLEDFVDDFAGTGEPDPTAPTGLGQQELTAMAKPDAAAHIAQELYNLQLLLWQGFDAALAYLAVTGLVYPDDLLLPSPLYQQFLSTPAREDWPLREEAGAAATYHLDPSSPPEAPVEPQPFPPGHAPTSFVASWSSHGASGTAFGLLGQILRGDEDSSNLDLDGDRGYRHACWEVDPGTSIGDAVLSLQTLPYEAE